MKRIYTRPDYCIACRLCEIHCLVQHSRSKKIVKAFRQERDTIVPGVQVEQEGCVSFALQCRHCDEAPCMEACITGALEVRELDDVVAESQARAGAMVLAGDVHK